MRIKKKRTLVRAVIIYLILTLGSWMFLNSYANSYNRFSDERIAPASLNYNGGKAAVQVIGHSMELDVTWLSGESRFYSAAYLIAPDELRLTAYLISFCNDI